MREVTSSQFTPDRDEYIVSLCTDKRVLHIGACDAPYTIKKQQAGKLLYEKISLVCADQLGIDLDASAATLLNDQNHKNSKILIADLNDPASISYDADIIIFGETIEHLLNLETFFTSIKQLMSPHTQLVISTPNAYQLSRFTDALLGKERQHPDHNLMMSYKTLSTCLEKNQLHVDDFMFTFLNSSMEQKNFKGRCVEACELFIAKRFPLLAGTLLVTASYEQDII